MSLQNGYEDYWARDVPAPRPTRCRRRVLRRSEVRCGAGETIAALASDGFRVSTSPLERSSSRRAPITIGSFIARFVEGLPWPMNEGSVDVVSPFEVIAPLIRPRRFAGLFVLARES